MKNKYLIIITLLYISCANPDNNRFKQINEIDKVEYSISEKTYLFVDSLFSLDAKFDSLKFSDNQFNYTIYTETSFYLAVRSTEKTKLLHLLDSTTIQYGYDFYDSYESFIFEMDSLRIKANKIEIMYPFDILDFNKYINMADFPDKNISIRINRNEDYIPPRPPYVPSIPQ